MNIDWNVKEYLKDFAFVPKYGEAVLDMIDAAPGTLAVDLGCGNGGLTGKLIERGFLLIQIVIIFSGPQIDRQTVERKAFFAHRMGCADHAERSALH